MITQPIQSFHNRVNEVVRLSQYLLVKNLHDLGSVFLIVCLNQFLNIQRHFLTHLKLSENRVKKLSSNTI